MLKVKELANSPITDFPDDRERRWVINVHTKGYKKNDGQLIQIVYSVQRELGKCNKTILNCNPTKGIILALKIINFY